MTSNNETVKGFKDFTGEEAVKREEIRTMAKDIARLREIEAQKEKERIALLEPDEIKKEKIEMPESLEKIKEETLTLIPKIKVKKSLVYKKFLVRATMIIIVLLLVGSLFYWFFGDKFVGTEFSSFSVFEHSEIIRLLNFHYNKHFFEKLINQGRQIWQCVVVYTMPISEKKNCSERKNRKKKDRNARRTFSLLHKSLKGRTR